MSKGTEETRRYYDSYGWRTDGGESLDRQRFWSRQKGPIRDALHRLRRERIRAALATAGTALDLLECGCGDNPQRGIADLCARYTGVDFSTRGIALARAAAASWPIPTRFLVADVCSLPFEDGSFDAVYCAHAIYHIEDPAGQAAAIAEMARVVRPGGVVVVIAANPRPWLFPKAWLLPLAARAPLLGPVLRRARAAVARRRLAEHAERPYPRIPYRAMPVGWLRHEFARHGEVRITAYSLPSDVFNRSVDEHAGFGRRLWQGIRLLEASSSSLSPHLGHYVLIACRKRA